MLAWFLISEIHCKESQFQSKKYSFSCNWNSLRCHSDVVSTLLQFGVDPERSDRWTPLMIACHNGHSDVVRLLLMATIDVNACLEDGTTAIYIACQNSHSRVVCTLLQFGADPNLKEGDGWTPLTVACQNGHSDVVHGATFEGEG